MTRNAKRKPHRERERFYGDVPSLALRVYVPQPLLDWITDYARQQGISTSALALQMLELSSIFLYDLAEEDGVKIGYPPGQYSLDSPHNPNNRCDPTPPAP